GASPSGDPAGDAADRPALPPLRLRHLHGRAARRPRAARPPRSGHRAPPAGDRADPRPVRSAPGMTHTPRPPFGHPSTPPRSARSRSGQALLSASRTVNLGQTPTAVDAEQQAPEG